jgi:hypothetical protein
MSGALATGADSWSGSVEDAVDERLKIMVIRRVGDW